MRKKGFTVIELVVSIALTSMVMILLFNMIFSLKDLYINAVLKTELLNKQTIMNQNLNKILTEKEVKGLYECGENCLRFSFTDKTNTKLEIDKKRKIFSIGNYKTKLVSGSEFGDIKLLTNTIEGVEENKNDSYLTLEIPVKHNLLIDEEYGINTIYQYDMEAMDIGTVDVVDMAENINQLTKLIQKQQTELNNLNETISSQQNTINKLEEKGTTIAVANNATVNYKDIGDKTITFDSNLTQTSKQVENFFEFKENGILIKKTGWYNISGLVRGFSTESCFMGLGFYIDEIFLTMNAKRNPNGNGEIFHYETGGTFYLGAGQTLRLFFNNASETSLHFSRVVATYVGD